jgi:hypothetical protein
MHRHPCSSITIAHPSPSIAILSQLSPSIDFIAHPSPSIAILRPQVVRTNEEDPNSGCKFSTAKVNACLFRVSSFAAPSLLVSLTLISYLFHFLSHVSRLSSCHFALASHLFALVSSLFALVSSLFALAFCFSSLASFSPPSLSLLSHAIASRLSTFALASFSRYRFSSLHLRSCFFLTLSLLVSPPSLLLLASRVLLLSFHLRFAPLSPVLNRTQPTNNVLQVTMGGCAICAVSNAYVLVGLYDEKQGHLAVESMAVLSALAKHLKDAMGS